MLFVACRVGLIVDEEEGGSLGKPTRKGTCAQLTALLIIRVSVDAVRGPAGLWPCAKDATQCP